MELILCQDVSSLGKIGDVVKVKSGYGRNFLLPKKLAYLATPGNIKRIEVEKSHKAEIDRKAKEDALKLAEKLSKVSCTVAVEVNDLEKLYGSVAEADIAKVLQEEGYSVYKKDIILERPIEELGIFDVGINVQHGVVAKVRVWVTKK